MFSKEPKLVPALGPSNEIPPSLLQVIFFLTYLHTHLLLSFRSYHKCINVTSQRGAFWGHKLMKPAESSSLHCPSLLWSWCPSLKFSFVCGPTFSLLMEAPLDRLACISTVASVESRTSVQYLFGAQSKCGGVDILMTFQFKGIWSWFKYRK